MVSMTTYSISTEHGREAKTMCNFVFWDLVIGSLGLANNELPNLDNVSTMINLNGP